MSLPTEWNLKIIYKNDDDPQIEKDRRSQKRRITKFVKNWAKDKSYMTDPAKMFEALKEYEKIGMIADYGTDEFTLIPNSLYWFYRSAINQNDEKIEQRYKESQNFDIEQSNRIQFFIINISQMPKKHQKIMLESDKLSNYHNFLKIMFRRGEFTLSEKEEKILKLTKVASHYNWVKLGEKIRATTSLKVIDENGKKVELPLNAANKYLFSSNKKVRRTAAKAFNEAYSDMSMFAVEEMNSIMQNHKVVNELKGIKRPDTFRLISDDVDSEYVDTLIETTVENNHLSNHYYDLKAKVLGIKKLWYSDKLAKAGEIDLKFTYGDATRTVTRVYKSVDEEYAKLAREYIDQGRIDVHPRDGKLGGGFCTYSRKNLPGYILMNSNDDYNGLTTLAHELGHAINHELYVKHQTPINQESTKAVAEVASNFFEELVNADVEKRVKDKNQLLLIKQNRLESDIASIFRQIGFYRFELDIHNQFKQKGYLSRGELGEAFKKYMMDYLGPSFEFQDGEENHWIPVMHFRMLFYVYAYASGLLITKSLLNIYNEDKSFAKEIKYFLSQGTNLPPKDIFSNMGIDIYDKSFWQRGFDQFKNDLDEYEELAKELGVI